MSRLAAGIIDLVFVLLIVAALYGARSATDFLVQPRTFRWPEPGVLFTTGFGMFVAVIYLTLGWTTSGRTPGKQFVGLRLVTGGGRRLRPVPGLLRAIACVIFPLGLLWCAVSARNASLQDLLVRSAVIYDWRTHIPPREEKRPSRSQ